MSFTIGPADESDLPAILAIYNREIREGTALWNTAERDLAQMTGWYRERRAAGFAVLAAQEGSDEGSDEGGNEGAREGAQLLGFASFGPFRPHDGYRHTIEHSLYVAADRRGEGIGGALLAALEREARAGGYHVMLGAIEAGNAGSLALHARHGFIETARMPEVGRKFGRWLTLVIMQKTLT
ncbi:MAG: N-acetyltransferase family protein [Neomegalonema sp.]|nr:N-acetyltransferase family protein [Neomegalonema sp.]